MLASDGLAAAHALALRTMQQELDTREERVAVLDRHGRILVVNDAWVRHLRSRGASPAAIGVGDNYLQWARCQCDVGPAARRVVEAVEDLLDGVSDHVEAACANAEGHGAAWRFTGTRIEAFSFHWFLVAHDDVRERRSRQWAVRPARRPVRA